MFTPHEFDAARRHMVEEQLRRRGIADERVLAAMDIIPRELFVQEEEKSYAYADRALNIDFGQTISQPYIVALMTEALELSGAESVLEIGTGSGYQTAVLCELAKWVYSIERHAGGKKGILTPIPTDAQFRQAQDADFGFAGSSDRRPNVPGVCFPGHRRLINGCGG